MSNERMEPVVGRNEDIDFAALEAPMSPVWLRRVPLPLDGAQRFQWRLAAVLLALDACRGKSASVEQLHTLVWVISDPSNAEVFRLAWEGKPVSRRPQGYVNGLIQTLKVAQIEGLLEQKANGRQKLTSKGIELVNQIRKNEISLGAGDDFLASLRPISGKDMTCNLGGRA